MGMSAYVRRLRGLLGSEVILLPSASAAIFDEHDRILLAHDVDTGRWVVPGGAIDPDESPADACVREAWEELGVLVEPLRVAGIFGGPAFRVTYSNGDATSYVMTLFECRIVSGELRPDGEELSELRYVGADELGSVDLQPWASVALPQLFAQRARTAYQPPTWRPPG
jgi:8-oxo-dGTP pyrophosphatase MutT (NUDIX family)